MQRLFAQMARIMDINHLEHVTKEVVEAARDSVVIGTTYPVGCKLLLQKMHATQHSWQSVSPLSG